MTETSSTYRMRFLGRIAATSLVATAVVAGAATAARADFGFATFGAMVAPDGTLKSSSGVTASGRLTAGSTGTYLITFGRPVNTCTFVASLTTVKAGSAVPFYKTGDNNSLVVRTFDATGTAANLSFGLIVMCGP